MSDARPLVLPRDRHNLRLLSRVHPDGHVNPTPAPRYNLVVLGGGPAGLIAAIGAAGLGARVALVERGLLGGDCLNVGCVPSKALLRSARAIHDARSATGFGARLDGGVVPDFAAAMERVRRLRADLAPADSAERLARAGVDVFLGTGRFAAADAIEVGEARLRFSRAVIATGARSALPAVPGLAAIEPLTNETAFWLSELPRRLVVLGAGPIACELGQAFRRFGSAVTIVTRGQRILPRDDPDAAAVLAAALAGEGIELVTGATLLSAERRETTLHVRYERGGEQHEADGDTVLVALGRTPNVESLELARAGIAAGAAGVAVDDRLRTTNPRVYAAGDVCSTYKFTHAADAMARIVIANALFHGRGRASRLVVPWCTYTDPEVAHVGLTAAEAEKSGTAIDTLTFPLAEVDRAVLDGDTRGFARVHLVRGSDRIAGATVVSRHAGDLIAEPTLAMSRGIGLTALSSVLHPYPTTGSAWARLADQRRRERLTPGLKRWLTRWLRLHR